MHVLFVNDFDVLSNDSFPNYCPFSHIFAADNVDFVVFLDF